MIRLRNVKYTLFFIFLLFCMPSHALILDESVDDNIRKNYNSNKLINDVGINDIEKKDGQGNTKNEISLPQLPAILNKTQNITGSNSPQTYQSNNYTQKIGRYKIKKHTSFTVASSNNISDSLRSGTKVAFKTQRQISTKNYLVPSGTVFYGEIIDSHTPQISCNGGLVVISVYAVRVKNETVPISAYITKANSKHIFFNNIKGKRTYLKTMYKKGNWGRTMFGKMTTLTVNLGKDGSTILLAPFPFLYGTICFGANTIISPITAFFSKGGSVYIPAGSNFNIKLDEDIYVD